MTHGGLYGKIFIAQWKQKMNRLYKSGRFWDGVNFLEIVVCLVYNLLRFRIRKKLRRRHTQALDDIKQGAD